MDTLVEIRDAIATHPRIVIKFGAPWCVPCTRLQPHLEKFAARHDELPVVKVNIDVDPAVSAEFSIQSVPQIMLFENGEYVRHSQARTVLQLEDDLL